MNANIACLPGDGIGPEVVDAAKVVLDAVGDAFGHQFILRNYPIGGGAIDLYGNALPDFTLEACLNADAVLLGAVGGPKWDSPDALVRPEQGLLAIRKGLNLFANLRPVKPHTKLLPASPLKSEKLIGVDLIFVRELTSGIYFGTPKERRNINGEEMAVDTMSYTTGEIQRVSRLAFELARQRRKKVTSIDKANVLESSRLWRKVVSQVGSEYPDVALEHILVDAAAMYLLSKPASFDVLVTENMFGDILTDEASVLTGSMGNLPSASIGDGLNKFGKPRGLYEPIHGSAPDIAGKGVANPIGTVLSAALMLRYSFGLENEALLIEKAVSQAIEQGALTADLGGNYTTSAMIQAILQQFSESISAYE